MRIFFVFCFFFFCTVAKPQQYEDITFEHAGLTLEGVISFPGEPGPHPVIVINPGSGANDRDGTIPMVGANIQCLYPDLLGDTLRPYRQLGDALTAAGYAVLRYDKVEYTYSDPAELGAVTFEKLWLPVRSALDYLRTRTDIDTSRMVLLGHSEGGMLLPYIARTQTGIRALVSVAGPRRPIDSLLASQLLAIAETCGGDLSTATLQANQILAYGAQVRSGAYDDDTPPLFGVPAAVWAEYFAVADSVSANYRAADLPTLFVGLGDDFNVPSVETDRLEAEAPGAEVYRLPGINHFLTPAAEPDLAPVVADTIVYWLHEAVTGTTTPVTRWPKSFNVFTTEDVLRLRSEGGPLERVLITNSAGQVMAQEDRVDTEEWRVSTKDWPAGWYAVSAYRGDYQQGEWVFVKKQ